LQRYLIAIISISERFVNFAVAVRVDLLGNQAVFDIVEVMDDLARRLGGECCLRRVVGDFVLNRLEMEILGRLG